MQLWGMKVIRNGPQKKGQTVNKNIKGGMVGYVTARTLRSAKRRENTQVADVAVEMIRNGSIQKSFGVSRKR